MFANESELVEALIKELQIKYNIKYVVRELRGGNNIADVVYTSEINRNQIIFNEYYNAYYYFRYIYNKKKINLDSINIHNQQIYKKFVDFLKKLEKMGYLKMNGSHIETIKKVDAITKNFIAIEAKISDWRSGIEQANRYRQFADEVYVAISEEYLAKVDKNKFKMMNIGLMSISNDSLKIVLKSKKKKIKQLDIQYYIMDRFLKQFDIKNNSLNG